MLSRPLNDFEIQKHYLDGPRFNGAYPRDNLHDKIKGKKSM